MSFIKSIKKYGESRGIIGSSLDGLSVISFLVSIICFYISLTNPKATSKDAILLATLLLIIAGLFILNFSSLISGNKIYSHYKRALKQRDIYKKKYQNLRDSLNQVNIISDNVSTASHIFVHKFQDCLLMFCGETGVLDPDSEIKRYANIVLEQIKKAFDSLTEDKCATCLQIYYKSDGQGFGKVATLARDNESELKRKNSDYRFGEYDVKLSDALIKIVSNDYDDEHYVCDNLKESDDNIFLGSQGYFNAILVVPIRRRMKDSEEQYTQNFDTFGFLFIDNMKGGFNRADRIQLAEAMAGCLYCIFYMHNIFITERNEYENNRGRCV